MGLQPAAPVSGLKCGAHLSVAGGVMNAFVEADRLGVNSFQFFLGSPRTWAYKPPASEACAAFARRAGDFAFVVCHAPYLLNPATPNDELFGKSLGRLRSDLDVLREMGVGYYVLHPGTAADPAYGVARVREALTSVLSPGDPVILIENTAAERNDVGTTLDELAAITDGFGDRVGLCLDTCHLFAAGTDLRTTADIAGLADRLASLGLDRKLVMIHANDALGPLGSHRDRHTHLGQGHIGASGFTALMSHPLFRPLPYIIETPQADGMDEVNLAALEAYYG